MDLIKSILSSFKLYVGIAAITAVGSAWLVDRHYQYQAGIAYCQEQENKKAPPALEKADEARKVVEEIKSEKQTDLVKLNEASTKANHSPDCTASADELFILNSKIAAINSSSGNASVSSDRPSSRKSKHKSASGSTVKSSK